MSEKAGDCACERSVGVGRLEETGDALSWLSAPSKVAGDTPPTRSRVAAIASGVLRPSLPPVLLCECRSYTAPAGTNGFADGFGVLLEIGT